MLVYTMHLLQTRTHCRTRSTLLLSQLPHCELHPQLAYAAQDAWLSRRLAMQLCANTNAGTTQQPDHPQAVVVTASNSTPAPCAATGAGAGASASVPASKMLRPFIERFNPAKPTASLTTPPTDALAGGSTGGHGHGSKAGSSGGGGKMMKPSKLPTRKTVLYENCRILVSAGRW